MTALLKPAHRWLPTPYSAWESAGLLWRILTGPSQHNPARVSCLSSSSRLNASDTRLRIAFIGDILPMTGDVWSREASAPRDLQIGGDVRAFVADCDALAGNFEGTIVRTANRRLVDQVHDASVLRSLAGMFDPARTYLSVANNHAGDFGPTAFRDSVAVLLDAGYNVFGTAEAPAIQIAEGVRLIGASMWSNKACDSIAVLSTAPAHAQAGKFNILFPHWGYEIESYPRLRIVDLSRSLLSSFDAIVGHHPHTPQPIASYTPAAGPARLVAYSLGNFCAGTALSRYRHGQIIKIEVGKTPEGLWAAGVLNWTLLCCTHNGRTTHLSLCGGSNSG